MEPGEAKADAARVRRTYWLLALLSTLAASFIWGINTLFLLDAGLNNVQAFGANACFTAGEVIFEIPTGVVADTWGRRASYLLGAATLLLSTLLYLAMWKVHASFWLWAGASALLGLGFTFFSGATEAWLVDALAAADASNTLDAVLAKGQVVTGAAMLTGAAGGGLIAQATNLGVPYVVRSALLAFTFLAAALLMKDLGFTPARRTSAGTAVRRVLRASVDNGLRNPPVRWLMLSSVFSGRRRHLRLLRPPALLARALWQSRAPSGSPGRWRRSLPARRSWPEWPHPGCGVCSPDAPARWSSCRPSPSVACCSSARSRDSARRWEWWSSGASASGLPCRRGKRT